MDTRDYRPTIDAAQPNYSAMRCIRCGYVVSAPPSRVVHVFGMHAERCNSSTPEERRVFRKTGRWPRRKK